MKAIIALLSITILRCCWGPSEYQIIENQQPNNMTVQNLKGTYNIIYLDNENVSNFKLNIVFNENSKKVSGFSGCNRFFGSYETENKKLKFGALGTTRMLCQDDANTIETKLLKALENANTILFQDNGFTLFKDKVLLIKAIKDIPEVQCFEYTASSRGFYRHIKITEKQISVSDKRNNENQSFRTSEASWDKLLELSKAVEIEKIPKLEPPSKKHQFDGAPLARLSITSQDENYETQTFDHGNPPTSIVPLVKEILSIAQNVE